MELELTPDLFEEFKLFHTVGLPNEQQNPMQYDFAIKTFLHCKLMQLKEQQKLASEQVKSLEDIENKEQTDDE